LVKVREGLRAVSHTCKWASSSTFKGPTRKYKIVQS